MTHTRLGANRTRVRLLTVAPPLHQQPATEQQRR
jgi:hypothetical protein